MTANCNNCSTASTALLLPLLYQDRQYTGTAVLGISSIEALILLPGVSTYEGAAHETIINNSYHNLDGPGTDSAAARSNVDVVLLARMPLVTVYSYVPYIPGMICCTHDISPAAVLWVQNRSLEQYVSYTR